MDMTKVGRLISNRRKELGLTQQELGLQLGVSAKAVSKWERGLSCPDVELLGQLSAALRVSIVGLLSGEVWSADEAPAAAGRRKPPADRPAFSRRYSL